MSGITSKSPLSNKSINAAIEKTELKKSLETRVAIDPKLIFAILDQCDFSAFCNLCSTSKEWQSVQRSPEGQNISLSKIVKMIDLPIKDGENSREQLINHIANLILKIDFVIGSAHRKYIPPDICKIEADLKNTQTEIKYLTSTSQINCFRASVNKMNTLQTWLKARDVLALWGRLFQLLNPYCPQMIDTSLGRIYFETENGYISHHCNKPIHKTIKLAKLFDNWFLANKKKLEQLETIEREDLRLTSLPEVIEKLPALKTIYLPEEILFLISEKCEIADFYKLCSLSKRWKSIQDSSMEKNIPLLKLFEMLDLPIKNRQNPREQLINFITQLNLQFEIQTVDDLSEIELYNENTLEIDKISKELERIIEEIGDLTTISQIYLFSASTNLFNTIKEWTKAINTIDTWKGLFKFSYPDQPLVLNTAFGKVDFNYCHLPMQTTLESAKLFKNWVAENKTLKAEKKDLDLRGRCLTFIPAEIGELTSLELDELDIGENQISEFPIFLCKFTTLKTLIILGNKISTIPKEFNQFTQLKKFYASQNSFNKFPKNLAFKGNNLTFIDLNHCMISKIPFEISELTKLKELYLNRNKLTALPDSFENLTTLQKLELNENQFSVFPIQICALRNLKSLKITHNNIFAIPDQISKLSSIISLDLSNNKLISVPLKLAKLAKKSLQILDISSNKIFWLADKFYDLQIRFLHNKNLVNLDKKPN